MELDNEKEQNDVREDKLDVRFISLEDARDLGDTICEKFKLAFELLKDK